MTGPGRPGRAPRFKEKLLSTTVYMTVDQYLTLKKLNELTRVPTAEYVRQAIDLFLAKMKLEKGIP